jgi:hypothetical protein
VTSPVVKTPTKPKPPKTAATTPQAFNSPDPYVGISNAQVKEWAMEEADKLENRGE